MSYQPRFSLGQPCLSQTPIVFTLTCIISASLEVLKSTLSSSVVCKNLFLCAGSDFAESTRRAYAKAAFGSGLDFEILLRATGVPVLLLDKIVSSCCKPPKALLASADFICLSFSSSSGVFIFVLFFAISNTNFHPFFYNFYSRLSAGCPTIIDHPTPRRTRAQYKDA